MRWRRLSTLVVSESSRRASVVVSMTPTNPRPHGVGTMPASALELLEEYGVAAAVLLHIHPSDACRSSICLLSFDKRLPQRHDRHPSGGSPMATRFVHQYKYYGSTTDFHQALITRRGQRVGGTLGTGNSLLCTEYVLYSTYCIE